MVGGPGTGKTRLAQALAGECGVAFIAATGSEFTSKYYGAGVQKVKSLFAKARKNAPCILFIDEIDGIAARSSGGHGPAEAESNRIINQVLVEMDGFKDSEGVIVIGATNLPQQLDPALLREGRFDRRVHVRLPDVSERADIFKLYCGKKTTAADVNFDRLARLTTGLSPAAIEAIVNHAAMKAAREEAQAITEAHLADAIEVNRMGEVNGTQKALTPHERERIAVHEAGHAVIANLLKAGRVEKVTILPRGGALGVTLVTQDEDKQLHLKSEMEARIEMLLAGRNAELLYYGEASSGAAHDLQEASKLALAMVSRFGFGSDGSLFSIAALTDSLQAQPELVHAIAESKKVLADLNAKCQANLAQVRPALDSVTQQLLQDETVAGEFVEKAVAGALAGEQHAVV
jgi:cell division protease FtsH